VHGARNQQEEKKDANPPPVRTKKKNPVGEKAAQGISKENKKKKKKIQLTRDRGLSKKKGAPATGVSSLKKERRGEVKCVTFTGGGGEMGSKTAQRKKKEHS